MIGIICRFDGIDDDFLGLVLPDPKLNVLRIVLGKSGAYAKFRGWAT
ncbi:MAG: hypothetical protein LKE41_05545 [Prevotella sp.]|jgi:hypothetical protein|nr:hypothetical protein [Prevotella sp.]MCI2081485.1 hypothetical protein [Prevotella sp.]MCI2103345.1 hypothetical protein [Prevotella sp.]